MPSEPVVASNVRVEIADSCNADRVAQPFKDLIVQKATRPVMTAEFVKKYARHFVAISFSSNRPDWEDRGAAKDRQTLADKMQPLKCGTDYYVHPIE